MEGTGGWDCAGPAAGPAANVLAVAVAVVVRSGAATISCTCAKVPPEVWKTGASVARTVIFYERCGGRGVCGLEKPDSGG